MWIVVNISRKSTLKIFQIGLTLDYQVYNTHTFSLVKDNWANENSNPKLLKIHHSDVTWLLCHVTVNSTVCSMTCTCKRNMKAHWSFVRESFTEVFFLRFQLTISQCCFRLWLGTKQATSHFLNQCWPSSLTDICGTRGKRVNSSGIKPCLLGWANSFDEPCLEDWKLYNLFTIAYEIITTQLKIIMYKVMNIDYLRTYRKVSNIRRTKSQNLNTSRLIW